MTSIETPSSGGSATAAGEELLRRLEAKVDAVVTRFDAGPFMRALAAAPADPALPRAVIREVYLEVWSYHRHVFEAAASAIGRLPKTHGALIRGLFRHLADEADHGEQAFGGYLSLGGDQRSRQRPMSPAAFAIASIWWGLARLADPFAYLGAMYLFEASTPKISGRLLRRLEGAGFAPDQLSYLVMHEREDTVHAAQLRDLIAAAVAADPGAAATIEYGLDCFTSVFPAPLVDTVLARVGVKGNTVAPGGANG